ncbi:response regulator [Candidatus Poribacteria bacterium]|nr:response regulator [Candidatus Poribacteria bacterium]
MKHKAKILIVDDERNIRDYLHLILSMEGYKCSQASGGEEALDILRKEEFDLLITDIRMPGISGTELIREAAKIRPHIASIVISAVAEVETAVESLKSGAYDYITKPFKQERLMLTIERALERRNLILENLRYQRYLEDMIQQRTKHVRELFFRAITSLVRAIEERDKYTRGHSKRVAEISRVIGEEMGLSEEQIVQLDLAGQLHDIGKIGIPIDEILHKADPLTPEEYEIIKTHPVRSYHILRPLFEFKGSLDEITMNENGRAKEETLDIILHHHERFDGKGYPHGLKGNGIPLGARILAVADSYDAMTSLRPYRSSPLSHREAIEEIKRNSGTQFDPNITDLFLRLCDKGYIRKSS